MKAALLAIAAALVGLLAFLWGSSPNSTPRPDEVGERFCVEYDKAIAPTERVLDAFDQRISFDRPGSTPWAGDDFMARLGIALHTALGREAEALESLARRTPSRVGDSLAVQDLAATDRKMAEALESHSDPLYVAAVLSGLEIDRKRGRDWCAFVLEGNAILLEGKRSCEKNRRRNLQDWWTVRCVWERRDYL